MLKVNCVHCDATLNCEERKIGQFVKCPKCGEPTKMELQNEPDVWNEIIRDEPVKPKATDRQIHRLKKRVRLQTVTMIAMLVVFAAVVAVMASQAGGDSEADESLADKISKLETENSKLLEEREKIKEISASIKANNDESRGIAKNLLADVAKLSAINKTLAARFSELEKKANAWDALVAAEARRDAVRKSALEEKWLLFSQKEKDRVERIRKTLKGGEFPDEKGDHQFIMGAGWDFLKDYFVATHEKKNKFLADTVKWLGLQGELKKTFYRRDAVELLNDSRIANRLKDDPKKFISSDGYAKHARNSPFFRAKLLELLRKKLP